METTGPHDGAKVALFLGDQLVSILRDDVPGIHYPGLWDLPGGGREGHETPFQTVARELFEELGLVLPPAAVLWQADFRANFDHRKSVVFFVARMSATAVVDIVFGDEGQRWALFGLDAFRNLPDRVPSYGARLDQWIAQTGGLPR